LGDDGWDAGCAAGGVGSGVGASGSSALQTIRQNGLKTAAQKARRVSWVFVFKPLISIIYPAILLLIKTVIYWKIKDIHYLNRKVLEDECAKNVGPKDFGRGFGSTFPVCLRADGGGYGFSFAHSDRNNDLPVTCAIVGK
jgi:hypothetical protein